MNKLEEQIEDAANDFVSDQLHHNSFNAGAQFVIDLDLPVKFAIWLTQHFDQTVSGYFVVFRDVIEGKEHRFNEGVEYEIEQVYEFWIENIYGK